MLATDCLLCRAWPKPGFNAARLFYQSAGLNLVVLKDQSCTKRMVKNMGVSESIVESASHALEELPQSEQVKTL